VNTAIPRGWAIAYAITVAALETAYLWIFGPAQLLWFSHIALLGLVPVLLFGCRLLASMLALAALLPECVWVGDFLISLPVGDSVSGVTGYVFDPALPLRHRALTLFHLALPPLLLLSVWRLGYDSRALPAQTLVAWVLLPISYWVSEPPRNINWSHGFGPDAWLPIPQPWYLIAVLLLLPLLVYLPSHLVLRRLSRRRGTG